MTTTRWTADKIRAALKLGKVPVVTREGDFYRSLSPARAVRLAEGSYLVSESTHEIVVFLDTHRKAVEKNL